MSLTTPRPSRQRRHLRLKEWQPSLDTVLRPASDYLKATDGSLADGEYRLRTDLDGFIVAPSSVADEGESPTVVFFGDSFVESVYVDEESRFVADCETRLRAAGLRVRCLNGGYSGATSLHLLMNLLGKVGRRPDTSIVFVVPSNDALALVKQGGYWCMGDRRYAPVVPVPEGTEVLPQPLDQTDAQAVLNLFVDACRRFRLPLILATFPHRRARFDQDPWLVRRFKSAKNYERYVSWRNAVNEVLRAAAKQLGLPFIDLDALLSEQTDCFYDDLHMNGVGSKKVAEVFANHFLRDAGKLPAAD